MIGAPSKFGAPNLNLARDTVASVLSVAVAAWPAVRAAAHLDARSTEIEFAGVLVDEMRTIKDARELPFRIDEEVGTRRRGARMPTGRIDIKISYTYREQNYLLIECKRVHGMRSTLAKAYVRHGVMRFVGAKYTAGHRIGVLFGFAIDNKSAACAQLIATTIAAWPGAAISRQWAACPDFGAPSDLYSTAHQPAKPDEEITLLHQFLAYPAPPRKKRRKRVSKRTT